MSELLPEKRKNYAVEFYRMMFCLSFAAIHVFQVYPQMLGQQSLGVWNLDCMLPFMAMSGFFLMQGYKSRERLILDSGAPKPRASTQAWQYMKLRLRGLLPIYLISTLLGFVVQCWQRGFSLLQVPLAILNALPEWIGLHITGIGIGNDFVGPAVFGPDGGVVNNGLITMNAPLWFIGAIFVAGYIVYFLIAWNEDLYLGLITPAMTAVLFATHHLSGTDPMWLYYDQIGSFQLNSGLLKMICLMSVGAMIWRGVSKWRNRELTRGFQVFLTIVQAAMGIFVIYRTWVPYTCAIGLNVSFSSVYLLTIPFTFLLLLNKDGFTRLMDKKIWNWPGKLALYFYMVHFPIMRILGVFFGRNYVGLFFAVLVCGGAAGLLLYLIDHKWIQPWLKNIHLVKATETMKVS